MEEAFESIPVWWADGLGYSVAALLRNSTCLEA